MIALRPFFICLSLFIVATSFAQVNGVRQAQSRMEKGKWESAEQFLRKAIHKDSTNVESKFIMAQWFFAKANPNRQIDSAYQYTKTALMSFTRLSAKQKERLQRIDLDSNSFIRFRTKIDSAAFERAKELNTEKSYTEFIKNFSTAKQQPAAMELRDEIGFMEALKINTWKSFQTYVNTYPQSYRKTEAMQRYEKLLYEEKTHDHKLESYREFLSEFPTSSFALEAEKHIFEISTAAGAGESFVQFIQDPLITHTHFKNQSRDILFHLLQEQEQKMTENLLTDSLSNVIKLNAGYWIPILQKGKFGFLDSLGREVIAPKYDSIDESYLCGSVKNDILKTNEGLISRSGKIFNSKSGIARDIGFGFLIVGDSTCLQLMHKSGKKIISSCMDDYQVIANSFLAAKKNNSWGLYALNGRQLLPANWQSVQGIENVIVLSQLDKKTVCTPAQLAAVANGNKLPGDFVFDEVRSAGSGFLLVRNGALEGILNSKLEFTVPLDRQSLSLTPYGLVRKVNSKYLISGVSAELEEISWDRILFNKQWLLLTKAGQQNLFDLTNKKMIASDADSIWFDRGLAFVNEKDSMRIHINSKRNISFAKDFKISFIKAKDSVRYFFTESKNKKAVFDITSGSRLFVLEFDQIESLTANTFLAIRKNKMGVLSREGKIILPIEYDAIVKSNTEFVSLFKEKKFGLFDLNKKTLIKPLFDKNLIVLNPELLAASKDKLYALISWDGKPLTKFEFDEIQPWTINLIWGRKNFSWQLFDFQSGKLVMDKVKSFRLISLSHNEKVLLVHLENFYGIISTTKGVIIPPTFSSIVNIGTEEYPLYFTDKEVEEASVHVVIYYDGDGKFLRKQVYEDEEFEKIFCD
jgi:WG containing repeat